MAVAQPALAQPSLHEAARAGNLVEVQQLLDAGAEVNAKDHEGKTPLDRHLENEGAGWSGVLRSAGGKCNRSC